MPSEGAQEQEEIKSVSLNLTCALRLRFVERNFREA